MRFPATNLARRCLPLALLMAAAFVFLVLMSAKAQAPEQTIRDATLQLWPEYDDPGLLVIFSGDFTDTTGFPREVAFPLPAGARGIQATERQADGRLISQTWQIVDGKLMYTLPGPGFHVEYYVDRPPSGDQREINYSFLAPYAIDALDIRVQQPARATDFSMTPPPQSSTVEADGLTYSTLQKTNLKPGDKLDLALRYKKTDQSPSRPASAVAAPTPVVPAAQPEAAPIQERSSASWLPWALIIIGLAGLAAAGAYWFTRGRTSAASGAPAQRARPTHATPPAPSVRTSDEGAAFCTQCGRPFRPEDRFCANCGAPR
jgi:hypothetical protein